MDNFSNQQVEELSLGITSQLMNVYDEWAKSRFEISNEYFNPNLVTVITIPQDGMSIKDIEAVIKKVDKNFTESGFEIDIKIQPKVYEEGKVYEVTMSIKDSFL